VLDTGRDELTVHPGLQPPHEDGSEVPSPGGNRWQQEEEATKEINKLLKKLKDGIELQ